MKCTSEEEFVKIETIIKKLFESICQMSKFTQETQPAQKMETESSNFLLTTTQLLNAFYFWETIENNTSNRRRRKGDKKN